jgi:hypothetical protein
LKKKKDSAAPADLPFLRFYHSSHLRDRSLAVLDAVEQAEDATSQRGDLAELVMELTEAGLDYYFIKPIQDAEVGFMAEKSTKMGISGILRMMAPVTRRVLGGMTSDQLLVVTGHLRHLMA